MAAAVTVPRGLLDGLSLNLDALSDAARSVVESAMGELLPLFMDAEGNVREEDWAALREATVQMMELLCDTMAEYSASLSTELYQTLRDMAGVSDSWSPTVQTGRVPEATEQAVRAFVSELGEPGGVARFVELLAERADYETRKAANECIAINAMGDPSKPAWARVPTGLETCPFCIMLASRGFAYQTEEAAGHAHANCDCRIVPGWDGMEVEGYDPAAYYDQWVESDYDMSIGIGGNKISYEDYFGDRSKFRSGSSGGGRKRAVDYEPDVQKVIELLDGAGSEAELREVAAKAKPLYKHVSKGQWARIEECANRNMRRMKEDEPDQG